MKKVSTLTKVNSQCQEYAQQCMWFKTYVAFCFNKVDVWGAELRRKTSTLPGKITNTSTEWQIIYLISKTYSVTLQLKTFLQWVQQWKAQTLQFCVSNILLVQMCMVHVQMLMKSTQERHKRHKTRNFDTFNHFPFSMKTLAEINIKKVLKIKWINWIKACYLLLFGKLS